MQILRNDCIPSRFILEEGLPTPCGDLFPQNHLLKRLSSLCFLSKPHQKVSEMTLQVVFEYEPQAPQGREN